MSTKNFPSTGDPFAYKPEYNQGVQQPKKNEAPAPQQAADPFAFKPEYNQEVKKKDGGNTSSDGQSGLPSESGSDRVGNDIAAPPATAPVDPNGLTPLQNEAYQSASNGPKISELYSKTYNILNKAIPNSPDPKINAQRQQLLSQVKNGDQSAITSVKQFIKTGIQQQIDGIKRAATTPSISVGGAAISSFNPSPEQKTQLDNLQKQQDDIEGTLNDYAINAAANSKEMQTQIKAEVSNSGPKTVGSPIAAIDLGKQIEKIRGGLSNPNGNMDYARELAGLDAIINNKQMKINDLISQGLKSKNQTLIQQAQTEQQGLQKYQGWKENLLDKYPDVATTMTARFIGDEIATSSPRTMIISKGDVLESAQRIEKNHPGFIDKFGKYISSVAESEGDGFFGKFKSGMVPKGGITGGLETGLNEWLYGGGTALSNILGDKEAAQIGKSALEDPSLQGTKQSGATPTKVIYNDKGKAFKEDLNEDYGKINWNSGTRFIGQSLPGLAQWVAAETATAGAATALGASEKVAALSGLVGASYYTSYDSNHKLAESLVDDNTSVGEGKKNAIANFLTLSTAGIFHMIGYSPTKFVEDAVTKSVSPDVLKLFEDSNWQMPTKKAIQQFMSDVVLPKAKTFATESAKSIGMGSKVAAATVADQKVKDFVSEVINPEKANPSTLDDNIKTFTEQALFMTLLGLPKSVVSGITSSAGKDALYDIGVRSPQYIEQINDKLNNGEYTQDQANRAIAATKTMAEEVSKVQDETTTDGKPLTVTQKKEIAVQNFRKRAAQQMKDAGVDISTEKVNHDADDQIKNVKSQNTHIPLEETEAFQTAKEIDEEGKEVGSPKDIDDIEPDSTYRYMKDGKEVTTSGIKLKSHLPESERYIKPEVNTDGTSVKEEEAKPEEAEVKSASNILIDKVNSGEVEGVYADMVKADPAKAQSVLKEIAAQAHGVDMEGNDLPGGPTDGGMPKEVVDAAKEAFPKEDFQSLQNDESEKRVKNYESPDDIKGYNPDTIMHFNQGIDNNRVTLVVDPKVKTDYSEKLDKFKQVAKTGKGMKDVLRDIAKEFRASSGKDVIVDLRGMDLSKPKDDIIKQLSSPKTKTNEAEKSEGQGESGKAGSNQETEQNGNDQKASIQEDVKSEGAAVPVEESAPSKQSKVNDIIDKIAVYNKMKNSSGEAGKPKRELLNEIRKSLPEGHTLDYKNGTIYSLKNENGNKVQKRNIETNRTQKPFSKESYTPEAVESVSTIADHGSGSLVGVDIPGADGRMMSESQKDKALDDIKNGVDTIGAKSVYDAINKIHENGKVEISDKITGQKVEIPVKQFMDEFKKPVEPLSDADISEINTQLGEEAFNKLFDEVFDNEINENEQSTEPVGQAEQPSTGTTEQNKENLSEHNEETSNVAGEQGPEPGSEQPGGPAGPAEESVTEEEAPNETVAINNAAVDERRLNSGLKPVIKEAVRKFGQTWQDARERVISGTTDPRSFVAGLSAHIDRLPLQAFGDVDNALVLMDRIDLTNQKQNALTRIENAAKSGNDYAEALEWRSLSAIEQLLQQNDLVADKIGTAQGRALSSRRLLAYMDYTLASMKRDLAKYYPESKLPDDVISRLEKIEKEHAEAVKKLDEYERKWKDQQAQETFAKQIADNKKSSGGKSIKIKGKELADKIRKLKRPGDTLSIDFSLGTYDLAIEGVAKLVEAGANIADAIDKLLKDKTIGFVSEKDEAAFRDHLKSAEVEEPKTISERMADKISEIAKNSNATTITKDMITPLRRLINDYARNGESDFNNVVDKVHDQLKDNFSDLTKEDIRDSYSGYGEVRVDSKKEINNKIRNWKKEATLMAQLDDVISGKTPLKGEKSPAGVLSDNAERLRKELEQKMKESGIQWTNSPSTPEEKNSRALQSLKTRLQNEINNLTGAIENKKDLPAKNSVKLDDEAKAMVKQRDELKDTLNKIIGKENKKTLTDEQRIARSQQYLEDKISALNDDISKASEMQLSDKDLDLLRARRDSLQDIKRKLAVDTNPASSESAIALEKYKDSIRNRLLEYDRRIQDGDFEEKQNKKSFENDKEAKLLELEKKRAEVRFKQEKSVAEKQNKTKLQKIFDIINKWKRFSVLTGIPTIGKLATAVTYRNVLNPVEEISGVVLKAIPFVHQLSKMAPREGGGFNFKAEKGALHEWAKADTWRDALQVVKSGQSDLDYKFGKYVTSVPEALEVMGRIHAMFKNFAKRSEFARSYEKRMQWAIDQGADPADALTQLTAQSEAYIDANRNIFMQDNAVVNLYNRAVRSMESSDNIYAKISAFALRFMLPIVKIPTNFVGESLNYSFGSLRLGELAVRGVIGKLNDKFGTNIKGAINDMTPQQADNLLRSIKKGSLGATAIAMGYYSPNLAGGYWFKGSKIPEGGPEWDQLQIGGVNIPKWATHFPLFEAIQLGATMRKVFDKDVDKGKTSEAALGDGIVKSARGMIGEVPLLRLPEEVLEGIEQGDLANKFIYPEIGSNIPIALQWVAGKMDTPTGFNLLGDPVKRTPRGFNENMEYRIPGLRQNVPTKEEAAENKKAENRSLKETQ